jgi:hypothetical protein
MTALSTEELIKLGYGTPENPHVSVHFDMFPHVYFTECRFRAGTTVDDKGGKVFETREEAEAYAVTHFDDLVAKEMEKLDKFKSLIPKARVIKFEEQDDMRW